MKRRGADSNASHIFNSFCNWTMEPKCLKPQINQCKEEMSMHKLLTLSFLSLALDG